jgi:hypothetical protein
MILTSALDDLGIEAGAIYVMDRGYLDFERLFTIHQSSAFFITRAKSNFAFKRLYSKPVDKSTGVLCDQIVTLQGFLRHIRECCKKLRYGLQYQCMCLLL